MTQHLFHKAGNDFLLRLNGIEGALILETHPMVWSPSPFALCMCELIAEDDISGKIVMDFAAGLGILGIVAGKQQAAKVIALDLNPHAISMAKHNWMLNNLDAI